MTCVLCSDVISVLFYVLCALDIVFMWRVSGLLLCCVCLRGELCL